MPGELLTAATEHVLMSSPEHMMSGVVNAGQNSFEFTKHMVEDAFGALDLIALPAMYMYMRTKGHASGHHESGVKEGRLRWVKPGEMGLVLENKNFYENVPVTDDEGAPLFDEKTGEPLMRKEFHGLVTPGFHAFLRPLRKYVIINWQDDEVDINFDKVHITDKQGDLFNLSAGMIWGHVRGLDEDEKPITYEYKKRSADKSRAAGSIEADEALYNAIMAAKMKQTVAQQLSTIVKPEIVRLLDGRSHLVRRSLEPEFYEKLERSVHDRFLERGSELRAMGVVPSPNPETVAAGKIAAAMRERNQILIQMNANRTIPIDLSGLESEEELAGLVAVGAA
jgi:hypothetical protein